MTSPFTRPDDIMALQAALKAEGWAAVRHGLLDLARRAVGRGLALVSTLARSR